MSSFSLEKLPNLMVRPRTAEEIALLKHYDDKTAPVDRYERMVAACVIDSMRYREARDIHPDEAAHFTRLLQATAAFAEALPEYFGSDISMDSTEPRPPLDDLEADDPIPQPDLTYANFHLRPPETRRIIVADVAQGASWEQLKTSD